MDTDDYNYLGVGIYTVPEASRLTGVPAARVRRWVGGHTYRTATGMVRRTDPITRPQLPMIDGTVALGFLDLLEVRVVNALLDVGLTWPALRLARHHAERLFEDDHPFALRRFQTDGRAVFADLPGGGRRAGPLVDLAENQVVFRELVAPFLKDVEFGEDHRAVRWFPQEGGRRRIVIDPARRFGQPIVDRSGVPTATLADAVAAEGEGSEGVVARWYDVEVASVRDAVAFERRIRKSAA